MDDEPIKIGPHLLGRKYEPDDRDWTPDRLHAHLESVAPPADAEPDAASAPEPPVDPVLDQTVREVAASLLSWRDVLGFAKALWYWIRHHILPTPTPTPVPVPVPVPVPTPVPTPTPTPVPTPTPTPVNVQPWFDGTVLDQGNFGTCVGNGWAGWGDCLPVADTFAEPDARAIYYEATVLDGHPDNPDAPGGGQQGSSVRAGAKAMLDRGLLSAYAFAATLADVDEWLDNHGPVVWGTNWTNGMFTPDADGFISPTGPVEGGHCWLNIGKEVDAVRGKIYECVNSWGIGWAKGGHFFITEADLATLLAQQGEACLAAELPR